ncbi:MAG: LysM peptidoglycan-binding domain-containing protein [Xanthomonadales bacterium]|nr:LysM peptidoglycan-binding domain-containing protein [Gammaproteobacteria bacterium]NNE06903.1 LysM peptidoglycan-binding domain-containing protein [Xanthomonadales bacterium]NNL96436.1 LysM peptidoglycan-binding domain-containing protein [Xanthomonadales bacterium]
MIRKLIYLILTTMLAGAVMAQDVSLRADHPDEYTVVRGDTLWDISAKFLDHPWQWPAIWHANQQIQNPHLIYPGDRISLVYVDGSPRLMVDRGKPTMRMSPDVRSLDRSPIDSIPLDVLKPFIKNARVITAEEFEVLPYVVANMEQRINTTVGDRTYVRGLSGEVGSEYAIVRLANIYYRLDEEKKRASGSERGHKAPAHERVPQGFWRPVNTWGKKAEIIGYEMLEVSRATLVKNGDPAILRIEAGRTEVQEGDLVMPLDNPNFPNYFMPRPMAGMPDNLKVLAIQGAGYGVGHYQIVAISGGSRQGVEAGHVFSAFRPGVRIRDEIKYPAGSTADIGTWDGDKVTLPDEYDAHIMVFRVFDEVSYAMVMDGARPVRELDILKHADETL